MSKHRVRVYSFVDLAEGDQKRGAYLSRRVAKRAKALHWGGHGLMWRLPDNLPGPALEGDERWVTASAWELLEYAEEYLAEVEAINTRRRAELQLVAPHGFQSSFDGAHWFDFDPLAPFHRITPKP